MTEPARATLVAWDTAVVQPPHVPEDPQDFELLFMALIGDREDETESRGEWFDFVVCTPRRLERNLREKPYVFGRYLLVVEEWDEAGIVQAIRNLCATAPVADWDTVADYLLRYGSWEFDPTPSLPS